MAQKDDGATAAPTPLPGPQPFARERWSDLREAWALPVVKRGFIACILMAVGGLTPAFLPRLTPIREHLDPANQDLPLWAAGTVVLMLGTFLLLDAWLRLRHHMHHVAGWAVMTWWSLPLLIAPPLYSGDAFSYAAQGHMIDAGVNPYDAGPAAVPGPFNDLVDPVWRDTPAPYGPVALQVQRVVVWMAGNEPFLAAVLMRLPALIGVAMLVYYIPRLAARVGMDAGVASWLAVLNPLVVMHFVGGSHNDALMVGFMVMAVWYASKGHLAFSAALVAIAALFKQPAVMTLAATSVIALGAKRNEDLGPDTRWKLPVKDLLGACFISGLVFLAAFGLGTWATGLGFGWIAALSVPGKVATLSPFTMIGNGLAAFLTALGHPGMAEPTLAIVRNIGTLAALVIAIWLMFQMPKGGPMRFLAWSYMAFTFGSPALHAWYLIWGGVFLPMIRMTVRVWRVVIWGTALMVSYSAIDAAFRNGAVAWGITAAIIVLWLVTGHDRDLVRDRERRERHDASHA